MSAIVRFNRKFTQAQLDAAVGKSTIDGEAVNDGSWYIASSGATALYVGSLEEGNAAVLKLVAQVNANVLNGKQITDLINTYLASGGTPTLITKVDSAVKDGNGSNIASTYLKLSGGTMSGALNIENSTAAKIILKNTTGNASTIQFKDAANNVIGTLGTGTTGTDIYWGNDKLWHAGNFNPSDYATTTALTQSIQALDATVTKTASSTTAAVTNPDSSVVAVSGFTIVEVDGKLVANSSSVTSVRADAYGAAKSALSQSKSYTDTEIASAIAGLGTIMHFQGTKASEADIKAITSASKGDVYINTADSSEWVCVKDITTADSTAWEKFGTTDVSGALYKGDNAFTNNYVLLADGTDGKVKAVAKSSLGFKTTQTAVTDSGTGYVSAVTQNTNGVITVTKTALPTGSGSVGIASTAAGAWKTVVHDVKLTNHTLSGATVAIPAATAGTSSDASTDGYMTAAQAYKLSGIATGAEVNQNAYSRIVVGPVSVATMSANSKTAEFTILSGSNINITATTSSGGTITISSPNVGGSVGSSTASWSTVVVGVSGSGHNITGTTKSIPAATTASNGYMTSTHVTNLLTTMAALTWEE